MVQSSGADAGQSSQDEVPAAGGAGSRDRDRVAYPVDGPQSAITSTSVVSVSRTRPVPSGFAV
jgi:hypothetical protein